VKVDYVEETAVKKALVFEIEPEVAAREIESRARKYAQKVRFPGFRPGKVPVSVVKQRLRQEVYGEAAEAIVNKVVFQELEGRGLKPVDAPHIQDLKMEDGEPMTFRAVFETLPIVELPDYQGLEVKSREPAVTEEDVDREVDRLREDNARFDPVEGRPAREGDWVLVDVAWKTDHGRTGRDEKTLLEVGSSDNHPDINGALIGLHAGGEKQISIEYPADNSNPELAGHRVDYTLALKAIKDKVVPAADDDFAKDLGELDTLALLRADIRRRLVEQDSRRADRELKEALIDALVARANFEVPESLVERHMTARAESAARGLAYQGVDPTKVGIDWRKYRESQREAATRGAKADILLDEIARRENIEASTEDVEAEVTRMAERAKRPREAVRASLEKEGEIAAIRARIREERTLDLLKAGARIERG
jgi:trigger factor